MKFSQSRLLPFASILALAGAAGAQTVNSLDSLTSLTKPYTTYNLTTGSLTSALGVVSGSAVKVNFPASALGSNPNVVFVNTAAYSAVGKGGVALTLTNIGATDFPFTFSLVDAAGSKYECTATIVSGATETFRMDPAATSSTTDYGMRVVPTPYVSMRSLKGWGSIDLSKLTQIRIYQRGPSSGGTVVVDDVKILAGYDINSYLTGIVDRFGQNSKVTYANKMASGTEFATRDATEQTDLAAHPGPSDRNAYGGYLGVAAQTPTGYFHTQKIDGRWWLIDPQGRLFFSTGVDGVLPSQPTNISGRTWMTSLGSTTATTYDYYVNNLTSKYGTDFMVEWTAMASARLRSWGFNTVGAFSDTSLYGSNKTSFTISATTENGSAKTVSTGNDHWRPLPDPFDPVFASDVAAGITKKTRYVTDASRCIGIMVDNELSWLGTGSTANWGIAYGAMWKTASTSPAKQAFLNQLKTKYVTVTSLNAAWGTAYAAWTSLDSGLSLPSVPNAAQQTDMDAFVLSFARKYFTTIRAQVKAAMPNALYLGCRFSWHTPLILKAADESCDVITFNHYITQFDPANFAFTQTLTKPCMITEFSYGATDRGLPNPGLIGTSGQNSRAASAIDYMNGISKMSNFVGVHMMQYIDEPLLGRPLDGANGNIGLVDITDSPYPEMVSATRQANSSVYSLHLSS